MKRILGALLLILVLGAIFALVSLKIGFKLAIIIFVGAIIITAIICIATELLID